MVDQEVISRNSIRIPWFFTINALSYYIFDVRATAISASELYLVTITIRER